MSINRRDALKMLFGAAAAGAMATSHAALGATNPDPTDMLPVMQLPAVASDIWIRAMTKGSSALLLADTNHGIAGIRNYLGMSFMKHFYAGGGREFTLELPDLVQPVVDRFVATRMSEENTRDFVAGMQQKLQLYEQTPEQSEIYYRQIAQIVRSARQAGPRGIAVSCVDNGQGGLTPEQEARMNGYLERSYPEWRKRGGHVPAQTGQEQMEFDRFFGEWSKINLSAAEKQDIRDMLDTILNDRLNDTGISAALDERIRQTGRKTAIMYGGWHLLPASERGMDEIMQAKRNIGVIALVGGLNPLDTLEVNLLHTVPEKHRPNGIRLPDAVIDVATKQMFVTDQGKARFGSLALLEEAPEIASRRDTPMTNRRRGR